MSLHPARPKLKLLQEAFQSMPPTEQNGLWHEIDLRTGRSIARLLLDDSQDL